MCDGKNGFEKTKHNFPYKWTLKDAVFTKDKGKVFSCFACGGGSFNEAIANERRKLRMSKATLRNLAITESNAVAATASGDSMTPTINDGDTIHIDLGRKEVKDGRIYVICIGGLHYCKRLYNLPFGGVRIVSDNSEEYEEIRLTAEERESQQFEIIGWIWQIAKLEKW